MPKKILAKKMKIVVRKGKRAVKPRKRRAVNNVKNITAPQCPVYFDYDLDTPPHQFARMQGIQKCGDQLQNHCKMKNNETAEDVRLIENRMSIDAGTSIRRIEESNDQFGNPCEMYMYQMQSQEKSDDDLVMETDQMPINSGASMQPIEKSADHENQTPINSGASMQRIEKFPNEMETGHKVGDVQFIQLENPCEMDTDHTIEGLESHMSSDTDDDAIVHGSITGGKYEKETECKVVSQERLNGENGKKIILLKVDVLDPIQFKDSFADTASSKDSQPHSPEELNIPERNIENAKIKIEELIESGNPIWEEIVARYTEDGSMSKRYRKAMIETIVQYARVKVIYIDLDSMDNISYQICKVFPTEIMSTYFMPKAGKGYSGCFYNLYHRKRSNDNKEHKDRNQNEINEPEIALPEPTESIAILKTDRHDDDVYIEKWKETFEYRQQKISQHQTFDDFVNEWPIIMKEIGFHLIKMDFQKVHGSRTITSHNWNSFFSNNSKYLMNNINDKGSSFFKKVRELEESPAKDAAMSFILHYLLPPALGAARWKPTCSDSQNTFLKFIKNECIDTEIANRNKFCAQRGIKWHPYIIGQGRSKRKIKNFMVVVHNTKFQCKDFLTALEFCLYLYVLLDIPYPTESKAVWILVNRMFINVKVETQMTSRIHQIVNDIN